MRNSIRNRLTWAFIGLAIGPLLLLGIILVIQSFATQREQAYNLQSVVAQRVSTQVTAFFTEIEDQLRIVSKTQGLQDLDGDKQRSILAELLSYQDVFENLALLDRRGQERVHLGGEFLENMGLDYAFGNKYILQNTMPYRPQFKDHLLEMPIIPKYGRKELLKFAPSSAIKP